MRKGCLYILSILITTCTFTIANNTLGASLPTTISVLPKVIVQGDPIMIIITSTSTPKNIFFDGKNIPIFIYDGKPRGLFPININQKVGLHKIQVSFVNGKIITESINLTARPKIEEPLGIPESLGGNTVASQKNLVNTLAKENFILDNLKTGTKSFWTKPFVSPLGSLTVTDSYGFNRKTGEYTIPHKGIDFRAAIGTKVYAMNRGVVRVASTYIAYGNIIVIDHGLGLNTLYLHLSKIYVKEGELVQPGELIGLSGDTGYAEGAHLHLSIKINGISIDPATFMKFFGVL